MKDLKNLNEQTLTEEELKKVVGGGDTGINVIDGCISGGDSNSGQGHFRADTKNPLGQ